MTKKPEKSSRPKYKPGRRSLNLEEFLQLRLSPEDRDVWQKIADDSRMQLSQWIRYTCAKAAGGEVIPVSVEFKTVYPAVPPASPEPTAADPEKGAA